MLEKIKEVLPHLDAQKIAGKVNELVDHIPVVNLVPLATKAMSELPARWDAVPDDKKQALFEAGLAALTRAAAEYASKGSK